MIGLNGRVRPFAECYRRRVHSHYATPPALVAWQGVGKNDKFSHDGTISAQLLIVSKEHRHAGLDPTSRTF
jgi:hypothetical protein